MKNEKDGFSEPYYGNDPLAILKFYYNFETEVDLVKWMKSRPEGNKKRKIVEVKGDNDIVVVVPTIDSNSVYSKECKRVFKGQRMIFSENFGHKRDRYFNYAKVCNAGLQYALKYNPKWIILSNDDIYKIDEFRVLKKQLGGLDNRKLDVVFTNKPNVYHSLPFWFAKRTALLRNYRKIRGGIERLLRGDNERLLLEGIIERFDMRYCYFSLDNTSVFRSLFHKLMFRKIRQFYCTGDFSIFSANLIRKNKKLFDETYINNVEDTDLCMHFSKDRTAFVDYRLGDYIGSSLGSAKNKVKDARIVANLIYFDYKAKRKLIE